MDNLQDTEVVEAATPTDRWLQKARQAYMDSTDYYESSLYPSWRSNLAHFRSEHAEGSKYTKDAYKHRSKVFRPKPRSAVRTLEATAATAFFTNSDLLNVEGINPNDPMQAQAADFHQALLQYRLEHTIPWFVTLLGAYQDTNVYGVCISRQHWDYRLKRVPEYIPAIDEMGNPVTDEDGVPLGEERFAEELIADEPAVNLIPPENFRFDPASDWRRPVQTSPYLIELIPMRAGEVIAMQANGWKEYPLGEIVSKGSAINDASETVRDAREGKGREDATEVHNGNDYSVVWVHRNILRDEDGQDWFFYTLGTNALLTDPERLEDIDPLGRDQYTVGFSSIEAHRSHPAGIVELNRPLTEMLNDVTNQRLDNVKLVLNKRYALRRGSDIDLGALMRNAPGGGVWMDDVNADYRIMETPDVTQSSYVEQDRLAVESDELLGTFSQASVNTNRNLNETVGGMNLMSEGANQIQELGLRTFVETWVEPVLRSLVKLEALYETDETILAIAAGQAELEEEISDDLMLQDLVVRVNVGMGNTSPTQKLERFMAPLNVVAQFPEFVQELDFFEIGKEVFSLAGAGDGSRFMLTEEKRAEKAESQGEPPPDPKIQVEEMRSQLRQMELELRQMEAEQDAVLRELKIISDKEVAMAKIAADRELTLTQLYERLGIEAEQLRARERLEQAKNQTQRDIAALKAQHDQLRARLQASNLAAGYDTF